MRPIKFKAKQINTGEWLEGDLLHDYWISGNQTLPYSIRYKIGEYYSFPIEIDPSTLYQFTAIRDTNLWEHDIVFIPYSNRHYVVTYVNGCFELVHHNDDMKGMVWGTIERLIELGWDFTVIGNIHDNENN